MQRVAVSSDGTPRIVRALDRGLAILDGFDMEHPRLALAQLTARTGLPKATVARLAQTLAARGYLTRRDDGYEIGPRCFQLGSVFRNGTDLHTRALPLLVKLRDLTGETVQLGVLSEISVVYLERVPSEQPVAYMSSRVGVVLPAYCTGLGKALLAYQPPAEIDRLLTLIEFSSLTPNTHTGSDTLRVELAETRRRGFAIDNEERELGVRCIAAPVFDHTGECIAAISVASPAERLPTPQEHPHVAATVSIALELSREMGFFPNASRTPELHNRPSKNREGIRDVPTVL